MKTKIILAILFIALLIGCTKEKTIDNDYTDIKTKALEEVKQTYQYTDYQGQNLRETNFLVLRCPGCFEATYEFDIEENEKLPSNVIGFEVKVNFRENKVSEIITTEKVKEEGVNSFESCVEAGNSVMESYPRQCKTEEGLVFVEEVETQTDTKTGEISR